MPAQATIHLDTDGNVHCEMPGRNGMRQKIYLPPDFASRNPELMSVLLGEKLYQDEQAAKERVIAAQVAEARAKQAAEEQAQLVRRLEKEVAEGKRRTTTSAAEWQAKYNAASVEVKAEMDRIKDAAIAKQNELDEARAKSLWLGVASDHSIKLANKVITDRKRRPNRRIELGNGQTHNPRTGKTFDKNGREIGSVKSAIKTKKVDMSLAVDITL